MADRDRIGSSWSAPDSGRRYRGARFRSRRARERDPGLIARVLDRHGVHGPVLDAPSGTGRLERALARAGHPVAAIELSEQMLAEDPRRLRARGSIFALPVADGAFDTVVCCRFLHHLREPADLERAVGELVRASRRLVVVSFWDAGSLPELRRRLGLKPREARVAVGRRRLAELFTRHGAPIVDWEQSLRFVSQQTFAVARKTR